MTAPALPAPCQWVTTVRQATDAVAAGYIPLIQPAEDARAARWAEVMRWYDPAGPDSTGRSAGDGSMVVASTTTAEAIGQLAAAALGRPHHHVETLTDTRQLPTERSVLIVAPARDVTRSALAPALDLWEEFNTRVGVLTGRDPAGMVFSLAKILAARASCRAIGDLTGRTVVLDGRGGHARRIDNADTRLPVAAALAGDWHTMVIDADGDASHAFTPHFVLCGLTSAHEADLDGRPVSAGCVSHRCKLAPGMTNPTHSHGVRAAVLGLLVPNAVAVGRGERYPSEVSLALDALDGFPAAVLGLARGDIPNTGLAAAVLARLLHAGTPLGQAARDLNLGLARQGLPYAALLLGDPEQVPPAEDAVVPSVDLPDGITLPVIVNGQRRAVPALLVRGRAMLADHVPDARVEDGTEPRADLLSQLSGWHSRLVEAELVEAALASAESSLGTFLPRCPEPMRAARTEAMTLVASTVGHLERFHAHREPGLPADPTVELAVLAERWASALADLLDSTSAALTGALTAALAAHHHVGRSAVVGPCDQCGALVQRRSYASPLPVGNRTERHCPRCGTISSHPDGGAAVMLEAPGRLHPGQPATVTAVLDRVWGASGLLYVQLKPNIPGSDVDDSYCNLVDDPTVAITLEVPPQATPDLHRIWALYACRFQLAVAQVRLPVVPTPIPNPPARATTDGGP